MRSVETSGSPPSWPRKPPSDPIAQLFVDKIREYKSKSVGGKLVDASAATEAKLADILANIERVYGAKGVDMTQFPTFKFSEPELAYPGLEADQLEKLNKAATAETVVYEEPLYDGHDQRDFDGLRKFPLPDIFKD